MPHTRAQHAPSLLDVRSWRATAAGRIGLFLAGLTLAVGGGWSAGRMLSGPAEPHGTLEIVRHHQGHS